MSVRRHLLVGISAFCFVGVGARAASLLTPEYDASVANAVQLQQFLRQNEWAKEFEQSNLYRGLMVRLAPSLMANSDETKKDTWKGRLLDFLYEKILQGKRLSFAYFHYPRLVSPFGVRVHNLSGAEQAVVSTLLKQMKVSEAQEVEIEDGKKPKIKVSVLPIEHRMQRFAVVTRGNCLTISRDPIVSANLSLQCDLKPAKADASVAFDIKEFFPAWYPVMSKFLGLGQKVTLTFDWDAGGSRFIPSKATLPLQKDHLIGSGKLDPKFLSAIPGDTQLAVAGFLPDPGTLSRENIDRYLRTARTELVKKSPIPVVLLHLGMAIDGRGETQGLTAVLLPQKDIGNKLFEDIESLFSQKTVFEVRYRRVCQGLVALSANDEALDKIDGACKASGPSFANLPPAMVQALTTGELSSGVYVNLGGFLASAVALGWDSLNWSPPAEAKAGQATAAVSGEASPEGENPTAKRKRLKHKKGTTASAPTEIAEAKTLVAKLPSFLWAGRASKDSLTLTGVK